MLDTNEIATIATRQTIIEAVEDASQERGVEMLPKKCFSTSSQSVMRFKGKDGRNDFGVTIRVTRKEDTLSWYILTDTTSGVRQYQPGTGNLNDLKAAVADATALSMAQSWEWDLMDGHMYTAG